MQHTVVADVGVTAPVGAPPDGSHDPPAGCGGAVSSTLPGSSRLTQVVGSGMAGPVWPHPSCAGALQVTPVGEPHVHAEHPRSSVAPP
jgi:hypothetical protein